MMPATNPTLSVFSAAEDTEMTETQVTPPRPPGSILKQPRTDQQWKEKRDLPSARQQVTFMLDAENLNFFHSAELSTSANADEAAASPNGHSDSPGLQGSSGDSGSDMLSSTEEDIAFDDSSQDHLYEMHAVTLTFVDKDMERRYVTFQSTHHGFLPGKIYAFLAGAIAVGLLFPYLNFSFERDKWLQTSLIMLYVGVSIGWLMFGLMFLNVVLEHRELVFFIAVATHWPAFAAATLVAKENQAYRYAFTTLCFEFCCFVAQPRFVGMFFFLTVTPIAALFISTEVLKTDYWDSHSRFEMLYWLMPLFPLFLLRVFEQRNRQAFIENRKGQLQLERLHHRENVTRRIITRFFPVSISDRMLQTRGREPTACFVDAALVSTSVVGFTEWAASTSAELVVTRVAATFLVLERLARHYNVEKVATLGDAYLGAAFPPISTVVAAGDRTVTGAKTTDGRGRSLAAKALGGSPAGDSPEAATDPEVSLRCHRTLRFATAVRFQSEILPLRMGLHVGTVIGGFVGIQPPKFDLFGEPVERARQLEAHGRTRRLHASLEIIHAAASHGHPSADFETSDTRGDIFSSWRAQSSAVVSDDRRPSGDEVSPLTPANPVAQPESDSQASKSREQHVQENALLLCKHLSRFGEQQQAKAMQGFETRNDLLRRSLAAAVAGNAAMGGTLGMAVDSDSDSLHSALSIVASDGDDPQEVLEAQHRQGLLGGDEDAVITIRNPGEELNLYNFSLWRMEFLDRKVKQQYVRQLRASNLGQRVGFVFALMSLYILGAVVLNTCVVSPSDRISAGIAIAANIANFAYLYFIGVAHRYHVLVTVVIYSVPAWAAALLLRNDCDVGATATGNAIAMLFIQAAAAPPLQMDVWMWARFAWTIFNSGQWCLAIGLRRSFVKDDVLVWDGLGAAIFAALIFISIFTDLAIRSGFQSSMRRRSLESNRSAHAERVTQALEMMLPAFVIERLLHARSRTLSTNLEASKDFDDASSVGSAGSRATALSGASILSSASATNGPRRASRGVAAHQMLAKRTETVWPYPRSIVMVVSFQPPALNYDVISDTVTRIEAVARGRSIQKVKTIGTTVLLVAGIDRSLLFEDAAVNVMEAALEVQRRVFPSTLVEGWEYRIGIHAGPVFGAVIGSYGLAFDIYGDTVTTARVIEASAPANTIRCTKAARAALPTDADLEVMILPVGMPVKIKGKTDVEVFQVHERNRPVRIVPHASARSSLPLAQSADDPQTAANDSPRSYAQSVRSSIRSAQALPAAAISMPSSGGGTAAPDSLTRTAAPSTVQSTGSPIAVDPEPDDGDVAAVADQPVARRALDSPSDSSMSQGMNPAAVAFQMDCDIAGFSSGSD